MFEQQCDVAHAAGNISNVLASVWTFRMNTRSTYISFVARSLARTPVKPYPLTMFISQQVSNVVSHPWL